MAQIQRQGANQNSKHDQRSVASQETYERQLQDASYEQRQMEVELCLAAADGLDDLEPESPDDKDDVDYDTEMSCEDEDAIYDEPQDLESIQAAGDCCAESVFASEFDAIYVVSSVEGGYKCLVEEDLSKWAYYHSSSKGKRRPRELSKEPSRMTCYRAIARWLEDDFQGSLSNPAKLIQKLKSEEPIAQAAFCREHSLRPPALNKAIKDSYLVWPDSALPLAKLFK